MSIDKSLIPMSASTKAAWALGERLGSSIYNARLKKALAEENHRQAALVQQDALDEQERARLVKKLDGEIIARLSDDL